MIQRFQTFYHNIPRYPLQKIWTVTKLLFRNEISHYPTIVTDFEQDFANYIGCQHGATFCNGTSALEAAMFALNIRRGDRVLVPAFTFHAAITPALNAGAELIFVDVDPQTANVDLTDLAEKAKLGAKALILTHLWGNPTDMDAVMNIVQTHQLLLVEDCSHTHGATWQGQKVGSFGDIGFFSFQADKAISSGEGGIAVTNNTLLWERLLLYGHFNRIVPSTEFTHHEQYGRSGVGHKQRAHPLAIALAQVDFTYLERENAGKRVKIQSFMAWLQNRLPHIHIFYREEKTIPGGFINHIPLLLAQPNAHAIVKQMKKEGVKVARCHYAHWHLDPFFTDCYFRESLLQATLSFRTDMPKKATDSCPNMVDFIERILLVPIDTANQPKTKRLLASLLKEPLKK